MATTKSPKYAPNSIIRYPKINCVQMCMLLLGTADEYESAVKEGKVFRRKRKPSFQVVQDFCWFYVLWYLDRKNVASFKKPLSREIAGLTGFNVQIIRKALAHLDLIGSIKKENSKTYTVRKELANRCDAKFPTAMSAGIETPKWTQRQLDLSTHMQRGVRTYENTAEDDEMQNMQATVEDQAHEIMNLKSQVMRSSIEIAGLRSENKVFREILANLENREDRITDRAHESYERGFDKAVDHVTESTEADLPPAAKPDHIKLVPPTHGKKKSNSDTSK